MKTSCHWNQVARFTHVSHGQIINQIDSDVERLLVMELKIFRYAEFNKLSR